MVNRSRMITIVVVIVVIAIIIGLIIFFVERNRKKLPPDPTSIFIPPQVSSSTRGNAKSGTMFKGDRVKLKSIGNGKFVSTCETFYTAGKSSSSSGDTFILSAGKSSDKDAIITSNTNISLIHESVKQIVGAVSTTKDSSGKFNNYFFMSSPKSADPLQSNTGAFIKKVDNPTESPLYGDTVRINFQLDSNTSSIPTGYASIASQSSCIDDKKIAVLSGTSSSSHWEFELMK